MHAIMHGSLVDRRLLAGTHVHVARHEPQLRGFRGLRSFGHIMMTMAAVRPVGFSHASVLLACFQSMRDRKS